MSIPADPPPTTTPLNRPPELADNGRADAPRAAINNMRFEANDDGPRRGCIASMRSAISKAFHDVMARLGNLSLPSFSRNTAPRDIGDVEVLHFAHIGGMNADDVGLRTEVNRVSERQDSLEVPDFDNIERAEDPSRMRIKHDRGDRNMPSVLVADEDYNKLERMVTAARRQKDEKTNGRDAVPSVLLTKADIEAERKMTDLDDTAIMDTLQSDAKKKAGTKPVQSDAARDMSKLSDNEMFDILQSDTRKKAGAKPVASDTARDMSKLNDNEMFEILQSDTRKKAGATPAPSTTAPMMTELDDEAMRAILHSGGKKGTDDTPVTPHGATNRTSLDDEAIKAVLQSGTKPKGGG